MTFLTSFTNGKSHTRSFTLRFLLSCILVLPGSVLLAQKKAVAREYIALKIYHAATAEQLATIDRYLQASLLPTLAKAGFKKIGVFGAIANDTAADKKMVVLIPMSGLAKLETIASLTENSLRDTVSGPGYANAAHNRPAFTRVETVLLQAFAGMPTVKAPALGGNREEQVYELRSYEGASEALYLNKVKMFNEGEVALFDRLGFNAVFYGKVIAGSRMPNLMYMTSFESKASRDEHWKAFGSDPEWKKMSALPEYQNNVSKIDITFLRPAAYSKL